MDLTTSWEWPGFLLVVLFVICAAVAVSLSHAPRTLRNILVVALLLRALGVVGRYEMVFNYYDGLGDSAQYFLEGSAIAAELRDLNFSVLSLEEDQSQWWGTPFVTKVTGVVVALIGPTIRGSFLVFSLLAFLGLCLLVAAFASAFPERASWAYGRWVFFLPSLWFWPSSIGKEALIVLATGLFVYGFVGRREAFHWLPLGAGLLLAFAIRPHFAMVLVLGAAAAHWMGRVKGNFLVRVAEALVLLVISSFIVSRGLGEFGIEGLDQESIQGYMQWRSGLSSVGGSRVEAAGIGVTSVPLALVNTLLRPFPWEVRSLPTVLASGELLLFWGLVYRRRRQLLPALRAWRNSRMSRLALPLLLIYLLMLGMVMGNLGIIARQRTPAWPLLLLWLEAAPLAAMAPIAPPKRKKGLGPVPARPPRRRPEVPPPPAQPSAVNP